VTRSPQKKKDAGVSGARASRTALTLKETQALFQEAILNHDDRVLDLLLNNSRTGRDTLFGVYQNGYIGRLVDILANDYEDLKSYLGEDEFDELARLYISAYPSRSQNARWFGSRMVEFLLGDRRYSPRRELADLAAIEQALANAFDAKDAPHLTVQDLAKHKPDDWGRLTFAPHPSVATLNIQSAAFAIWRAVKDGKSPPRVKTKAAHHLLIWRQGTTPMIREISAEESMMWTEACRGLRFEALCEMAATFDDPDGAALRAAQYLQGWLSAEMMAEASLSTAKRHLRQPGKLPAGT
jgi:Putative DNA-binding domain